MTRPPMNPQMSELFHTGMYPTYIYLFTGHEVKDLGQNSEGITGEAWKKTLFEISFSCNTEGIF